MGVSDPPQHLADGIHRFWLAGSRTQEHRFAGGEEIHDELGRPTSFAGSGQSDVALDRFRKFLIKIVGSGSGGRFVFDDLAVRARPINAPVETLHSTTRAEERGDSSVSPAVDPRGD